MNLIAYLGVEQDMAEGLAAGAGAGGNTILAWGTVLVLLGLVWLWSMWR